MEIYEYSVVGPLITVISQTSLSMTTYIELMNILVTLEESHIDLKLLKAHTSDGYVLNIQLS